MAPARLRCFVQIAPGFEPMLADELAELGIDGAEQGGGVEARTSLEGLYAIHFWSRLAGRVTVEVARGPASSLAAVADVARRADWAPFLAAGQPVEVKASGSALGRRDLVERKVGLAVSDALGRPRSSGRRAPRVPARVGVRQEGREIVLVVDASGDLLHRRGWRRDTTAAPLRENLAAAVLRAAGWVPGEALVDPMCGSGTFVIEAAAIAAGLPPGGRRHFAFELWPCHDAGLWERVTAPGAARPVTGALVGADRSEAALEAARANARRAGVAPMVQLACCDVAELEPPPGPPGLVVANPPWGKRLAQGGADGVLRRLATALHQRWAGWRVAILTPDHRAAQVMRMPLQQSVRFANGGIRVGLWLGEVSAPER